jgi:small subunit ribosomal protein S20
MLCRLTLKKEVVVSGLCPNLIYMANTRSAAKRARQTAQRTLRNKSVLTGLKRRQKKFLAAVVASDKVKAELEMQALASELDKAAKRGVVHQNLANRRKSRAAKVLSATGASKATG